MRKATTVVLAILLCTAMPRLARAEIARALSVGGRRVDLATPVRDGAALVCLRERPWQEACDLLCRGLDLQLTPKKDEENAWTLERDPAVAAREARWRRLLAHNVREQMLARLREALALMRETPDALKSRDEKLTADIERLRAAGQAEGVECRRLGEDRAVVRAAGFWGPRERLTAGWLSEAMPTDAQIEALLEKGREAWTIPFDRLPADRLRPALTDGSLQNETYHYDIAIGDWLCSIYSRGLRLTPILEVYSHETHRLGTIGGPIMVVIPDLREARDDSQPITLLDWVIPGAAQLTYPAFGGFGDEAVKWREAECAKTAAFLASARGKKRFAAPAARAEDLSGWVEAWRAASDADVVMELCPGAEDVSNPNGRPFPTAEATLADALKEFGKPERGPWTLEENRGALLVRNQLGFLYRPRRRPLAELVMVMRAVEVREAREAKEGPKSGAPDADPWRAWSPYETERDYALAVARSDYAHWDYPSMGPREYRGHDLGALDRAALPVFLWDRMPARKGARCFRRRTAPQSRSTRPCRSRASRNRTWSPRSGWHARGASGVGSTMVRRPRSGCARAC